VDGWEGIVEFVSGMDGEMFGCKVPDYMMVDVI
jgi:hypothetical protein